MEPWPLWKGQRLPRGENHERPTTKMTREVGLGRLWSRPSCQPDPQPGLFTGYLLGALLCSPGGWGQGAQSSPADVSWQPLGSSEGRASPAWPPLSGLTPQTLVALPPAPAGVGLCLIELSAEWVGFLGFWSCLVPNQESGSELLSIEGHRTPYLR